ncbi:MAG: protein translocase subunit SecD [Deinococcales bacterium]
MNRRTFTGALVIAAIVASILYLWQPWTSTPPLKLGLDLQGGLRVVLQSNTPNPSSQDLATARNVIENRINQFGVSEPLITTSGKNRIVVELPGLTAADQKRALALIGEQAKLYFQLVKTSVPANTPVSQMTLNDLETPAFTGEIISTASSGFQQLGGGASGGPAVFFNIKGKDAGKFGDFTANNIGRRMAIVLDGKIITAPTLQSRISDSGQITGIQSIDEASNIALVLRSGSLPISLHVEEINAIGPTLGQDSINAGKVAAFIGGVAVIAAVVGYYGVVFGGILTFGLGLAMLFIFGTLAGLHAALTLPGLAGLVLTIGAAVDGNVISFERIREELRAGKSLRLSMKTGFGNSLSAIIDANVTTLLAAGALYQYTTGPVRGFAITLAIGIVASVFVNVVVVPYILDLVTAGSKRTFLWKGFFVEGVRFVSKAPVIMSISGLLAVASIAVVATEGLKLSTDFTGGTTVLLNTPAGTTVSDVRSAIDALHYQGITGQNATVVKVIDNTVQGNPISVRVGLQQSNQGSADQFANDLATKLHGQILQANYVGPAVGADLRQAALMAVLVALGLILLYVAWRFWPNWIVAVAAIIATIHDAGIVLGALDLFNVTFSIPVLAAVLFVVGYSLNDSIVIADRIRENLRKVRDRSYAEVVDLAVNQTLSRTIGTSGTTLLPVIALFLFGGSVLRGFSIALLVGIGFGTYSSIFILSPLVVWFKTQQQKRATRSRRRPA